MIIVLYRGVCREWERCLENQVQFIHSIDKDVIYGIHHWDKKYERLTNREIGLSKQELPVFFKDKKVKYTVSPCEIIDRFDGSLEAKSSLYSTLRSIIYSYKNSLELYPDMPDDQLIISLRYDGVVNYVFSDNGQAFVGMWNIRDRPVIEIPEVNDICFITRKHILDKLCQLSLDDILTITDGAIYWEHYFYKIFNHLTCGNVTIDKNLHGAVVRPFEISYCS